MDLSRSSKPAPDVLSDVLATLGTRGVRGTRFEASGAWSLSFQGRDRLKFVAVVRGRCWLVIPGAAPESLSEGDIFLLSDTPYTVASDPRVEPVDGMRLFEPGCNSVRFGAGADASFIFEALPSFLRVERA